MVIVVLRQRAASSHGGEGEGRGDRELQNVKDESTVDRLMDGLLHSASG